MSEGMSIVESFHKSLLFCNKYSTRKHVRVGYPTRTKLRQTKRKQHAQRKPNPCIPMGWLGFALGPRGFALGLHGFALGRRGFLDTCW